MKIAVIATSKIPSTTANSIQVMKICQAYRQIGLDVILFVPVHKPATWSELAAQYGLQHRFEIRWIPARKSLHYFDFIISAVHAANQWGADKIHTWVPQISSFLKWIKKPILIELHEMPAGRFGPGYYRRLFSAKKRIRFLPITKALWQRMADEFGFDIGEKDYVISPDGVDIERYRELPTPKEARQMLNLPNLWSAVYTGHLYTGRGMSLLVELARQLPEIQFIWVGGNPIDLDYWKSLIANERIENIVLTGYVKNKSIPLYQAAGNVLLMPYEKTVAGSSGGNTVDICSPMKMFEYMAAGRVIISSDLPVIHEVLNTSNAIFCKTESSEEWAEAIQTVQADPDRFKTMVLQAKEDVEQYSWVERAQKGLRGLLNA